MANIQQVAQPVCFSAGKMGPLGKSTLRTDVRKRILRLRAWTAHAFLELPFIMGAKSLLTSLASVAVRSGVGTSGLEER